MFLFTKHAKIFDSERSTDHFSKASTILAYTVNKELRTFGIAYILKCDVQDVSCNVETIFHL